MKNYIKQQNVLIQLLKIKYLIFCHAEFVESIINVMKLQKETISSSVISKQNSRNEEVYNVILIIFF